MALRYEDFLASTLWTRNHRKAQSCMLAEVRAYLLRELREQVGFTAAQLAERIGMRRHLKAVTGRSLLSMF